MLSRTVFSDLDCFSDVVCGPLGRYVPTGPGKSEWSIEQMLLPHWRVQQVQLGAAATFAGVSDPDWFTVALPLSDPRAIRIDGGQLAEDQLVLVRNGQGHTYGAIGPTRWFTVSAPIRGSGEHVLEVLPCSCARRRKKPLLIGADGALRLREFFESFRTALAAGATDPATALAAEDELRDRVASVLAREIADGDERTQQVGRPVIQRNRIIRRCLELLSSKEGLPVSVRDLCAAAGVPERTLRSAFTEYFGVGPMHLLKARQLQEVMRALLAADPSEHTVSGVAQRWGVWDLGHFSRRYRALYAEMPSATLARFPMKCDVTAARTPSSLDNWLQHALRYFAADSGHNL